MTLGMRRIQEQKENGIKPKKNWNGNKNYETMFNIDFFRFQQSYIDF